MKILAKIISLAALAVSMAGCSVEITDAPQRPVECVEVGFYIPTDDTRTTIAPDGITTHWTSGDKLAVWAKSGSGDFVFENTVFSLRHFSETYDKAFFTANIAEMEVDEYTYMLAYPRPKQVNGTLATYTLSASQSGKYDGIHDIMVAEPVKGDALTSAGMVSLNTTMRHQMHAIKITIPEGRNLYGSRFYRLEITFPVDVVGDVMIDVSDPNEAPVYSNTSNVVTVESAEGFDAGDDIWVFVLPGTVEGDVSYRVRGEMRHSNVATYGLARDMKAGHVTPIRMAIPEIYPYYTAVHFSIDQNNLGEDFNYFDVYDANGVHMGKFERNASNKYSVAYEGEFDADQYDNTSWRIVFDSEHATVETSVNLGDLTDYSEHTRWMNVPYLFSEDFSAIPTFSDGHDNVSTGFKSDTYNESKMLDSYASVLAGWSGGRIGGSAGQSIRICCRFESGLGAAAHYKGRVDTAPITTLKSGVNAKVKVMFDYGADRAEYGIGSGNPTLTFGYTTDTGALAPSGDLSNIVVSASEVTSLSGSFTSTSLSRSVTIDGLSNGTRLSWQSGTTRGNSFAGNGNYWIYLDNIKVQIAQ